MLNDDYTPMEFVIEVLEKFFGKRQDEATQIMFQLNPNRRWSINQNLYKRNPDLNNRLKIWTNEPKFTFLTCMNDKRKIFIFHGRV